MNSDNLHKPEFNPKAVRSYVIRAGRITASQKQALERQWPRYGLSLRDGLLCPQTVFARTAPLVVEIGFGMGESLLAMAENEPQHDFVGIEVHPPGVGRLINRAAARDLHNLRVYMADAIDVLGDCIADHSIDRPPSCDEITPPGRPSGNRNEFITCFFQIPQCLKSLRVNLSKN